MLVKAQSMLESTSLHLLDSSSNNRAERPWDILGCHGKTWEILGGLVKNKRAMDVLRILV